MSTDQEKDTGTSKNNMGRRKNLWNRYLHEIPDRSIDIYQANPLAKCRGKRIQYVDRWVKPFLQLLIAALRFPELVDLVLEYSYNGCGRVAFLQLGGERMSDKILFGLFCIFLEGFFENGVEIGRGFCRCRGLRYRARSGRLIHAEWMVLMRQMRGSESLSVLGSRAQPLPIAGSGCGWKQTRSGTLVPVS